MALRFYHKGGTAFGVTVGQPEVHEFKRQWPASGLGSGPYYFEFDSRGNLVDVEGPGAQSWADGPALVALSEDAQEYGKCRMQQRPYGSQPRDARKCQREFRRRWIRSPL